MKTLITSLFALALCAVSAGPAVAGCGLMGPGGVCLIWTPDPPPGGRDCTNSPPVAGEFATYTGTAFGGWCQVWPAGNYPNTNNLHGFTIQSVRNLRSGTVYGYQLSNYGGNSQFWVGGQSASALPWSPYSFVVH